MEQPNSVVLEHSHSFLWLQNKLSLIPFEARVTGFLFVFVCFFFFKIPFVSNKEKTELFEFKRLSAVSGEMAHRESMKTEFGCPAPMFRAG